MVTYDDIKNANDATKPTDIHGKDYVEVNQRIKAFRMVYPDGFITTEEIMDENGISKFRAMCGFHVKDEFGNVKINSEGMAIPCVIGTGHAFEVEGSNFINETSHVENAETSAIGRCLASAGFGINESVASYEEVANAKANQKSGQKSERKASEKQLAILRKVYTGDRLTKLLQTNDLNALEDISMKKASDLIGKLNEKKEEKENE